ncbi:hypothetical protein V6N13_115737 [Hibiscus sabdariffa]
MEKEQTTTLFVHNIPTRMHWKGLWHAFGKHGDVVDAFIARKMSRVGKRFGFVRFARRSDADRAMGRLNGFSLYGFRIFVAFAKFNGRSEYWRKVRSVGSPGTEQIETNFKNSDGNDFNANLKDNIRLKEKVHVEGKNAGETSKTMVRKNRRISGHVEEEELWKLKRCLVGTTTTVCSVKSIVDRLLSWGLGEIKIQRLGGKTFLISIDDEELFQMLEDLDWSYLKEFFVEVKCQKGKVEPSSVVSHRAVDNSRCLGLLSDVSEGLISKESTKKTSSWAASVDALNNALNNNYDNLDSDKSKRFWGLSCGG